MNEVHAEDTESKQANLYCDATASDESLSRRTEHEIVFTSTDTNNQENFSDGETNTEDNPEDKHRRSDSSCTTENSVLSPRASLAGLQTLNETNTENPEQITNAEEILMYEQGVFTRTMKNSEQFGEFESRCSSPLLNGHADKEGENKNPILLEPQRETNNYSSRGRLRGFSLFNRKTRANTAQVGTHNLNNDVVITVDEELTSPDKKPKSSMSMIMRLRSWLEPMENKMNMKLLGGRKAMAEEVIRYRGAGWIIHPRSAFRLYWDLIVLSLLIINMFVLPVAIAFFNDDMSLSWIAFNSFSDGVFLLDIVLNFRTGVLVHGAPEKFVLDPKKIAIRYLTTWFSIDLVSSFPFDYVVAAANSTTSGGLLGASRALRILRLAKLLSLLRLLRISRLVRYVQQYEAILNVTRSVIRFVNLISLMMLVAHWNGCMQFLVPVLDDFPDNSWVMIHNLKDKPWTEQYLWALFKALSHMLCIGYGRHPPQNIPETCVTIFSMMTGATFYALFIAYSINVISQIDSPGRQYREKIQQIEDYMAYRRLPVPLRDKISKYYEHRFQGKLFDEGKILGEVSRPLKEAIVNFNCRELVRAVPFFYDADPDFVSAMITKLNFEVYLEGDIIIREGELGTEMYFLKSGVVSVSCDGMCADDLTDGSYFGEICLLTNARRTATIEAKTVCDIFVLHAEDFREVVDEYPAMRQVMESVATQRLSRMGKSVDFSACPSKECLLPRPASSPQSSFCSSCSNLLQPGRSHPEIVITRDVASLGKMADHGTRKLRLNSCDPKIVL